MTRYGFLSTYPPTHCGLATFSEALLKHLTAPAGGDSGGVVRVLDLPANDKRPEVAAHLVNGVPGAEAYAASQLNRFDVAVVQHEFGIYGGRDGEDLLRVFEALAVPSIVVLHTVLAAPTPHQHQVLERVADAADAVVVLSNTARDRLRSRYVTDYRRVVTIPHGALAAEHHRSSDGARPGTDRFPADSRPTILSWGLLGPGKGIEWGIDALAKLRARGVQARYVVIGQTHPRVVDREGERYRESLRTRARQAGVADAVHFDAAYRDTESLLDLVSQASVVLLPYDTTEQATSGVLIEAVAARRPVVATDFPHARELLSTGSGILVPHRDGEAMAEALARILTNPHLAASMSRASAVVAPSLDWRAVAGRYRALAERLIESSTRLVSGPGRLA